MQLTIDVQETVSNQQLSKLILEIKNIFEKEKLAIEIKQENVEANDPWDNLNIEDIAVDTGIEDLAENHDHYLYGTEKRS